MTERDELAELRAALSTACAQRDTYRRALRKIAALPEAAPAREAIGIAEQALQHQTT